MLFFFVLPEFAANLALEELEEPGEAAAAAAAAEAEASEPA